MNHQLYNLEVRYCLLSANSSAYKCTVINHALKHRQLRMLEVIINVKLLFWSDFIYSWYRGFPEKGSLS